MEAKARFEATVGKILDHYKAGRLNREAALAMLGDAVMQAVDIVLRKALETMG